MALLWPTDVAPARANAQAGQAQVATVARVTAISCQAPGMSGCARASATLLTGPDKGQTATFTTGNSVGSVHVSPGQQVRVLKNQLPAPVEGAAPSAVEPYTFLDFQRQGPLLWLAIAFGLVVVLFGRLRGAMSLIGLGASLVVVFAFMVPAMLSGEPPIAIAAIGGSAVMILTIALAHGLGAKSFTAILGTAGSLALTIALAVIFSKVVYLTGLSSEESSLLMVGETNVSLQGLVVAGMVIGALGVLDDVTVSQASTVLALRRANPSYSFGALYREALDVGHDHVAATVNTLVLAYVGASLPILLIFSLGGASFSDALNNEAVAEQIVAMLVGSIGLIAAVPVTTLLTAWVTTRMDPATLPADSGHGHAH
jgi:uncharacterized membrane protein